MKPFSLREPEIDALQLNGRRILSGVESAVTDALGDVLSGLVPTGGELEPGVDLLWWLDADSNILHVRPLLSV